MRMTKLQSPEDHPVVLMAIARGLNAVNITQATIGSISYQVWQYASEEDLDADEDGTEVGTSASLTVSQVVFDTLQTDYDWTADTTGYNFRMTLPAARLPDGGKWYRVEAWATPVSGDAFLLALFGVETIHTVRG